MRKLKVEEITLNISKNSFAYKKAKELKLEYVGSGMFVSKTDNRIAVAYSNGNRLEFLSEAGSSAERQETGLVNAIQKAFKSNSNKPFTLVAGKTKLPGVKGATKFMGRAKAGNEPYTDVIIHTLKGDLNLSNKGESAPSLAGGGAAGIETIIPGFLKKYLDKTLKSLKSKNYKKGDVIPDIFFALDNADVLKLAKGTKDMGGPIHYMYIGPMDVKSQFKNKTLTVNGNLTSTNDYVKTHKLYLRMRKRRVDQPFDPDIKDNRGNPRILGKSPSKGDIGIRLVISDKPSGKAIVF